jgi:hypothetical protein
MPEPIFRKNSMSLQSTTWAQRITEVRERKSLTQKKEKNKLFGG